MLEYVFFDPRPFDLFVTFLEEQQLGPETSASGEVLEIRIPDQDDDELVDRIEARYDELMEMNQRLVDEEQGRGPHNYHMAGVVVTLSNGVTTYAHMDPALLARVMKVVSAREFGEIVNAIVDAVENPDERSNCQKVRDGDIDFSNN